MKTPPTNPNFFLLLFIPFLTGCFALLPEREQMEVGGRYAELVKLEEANIAEAKAVSTEKIYNLCYGYAKTKNYQKLFSCTDDLEQSIAKGDKGILLQSTRQGWLGGGSHSDGSAYPSIFRAEAQIDLGDYGKATGEAERAVASCAGVESTLGGYERMDCFIAALGLQGLAAALDGNPALAEKTIEEMKSLSLGFYAIAITTQKRELAIAKIYAALGKYQEALEHLHDNWSGMRVLGNLILGGGPKATSMFAFLEMPYYYIQARCLIGTERMEEAKPIIDDLLAYPQVGENGEIYWMLLLDRGRIAEKEGDMATAIEFYRKSVEVIERQRSTINTEASKIGFVGDKQAAYVSLIRLLLAKGEMAAAFEYVERSKARALIDMLAAKQDFAIASGDSAKVRELFARVNQAEADALMQDIDADKSMTRSAARGALEQLSVESPELASLISVSSMTSSEVQSLLPPDEILIEYYQNGNDLIAFVVSNAKLAAIQLDGAGLLENVRHFREQLEDVGDNSYLPSAQKLYDRLLRPLAGQLSARKFAIVAHGPLHYLPFNALHDGDNFLIDRYSLRMLPSASVIKYIRPEPVAKPGDILALGNPDLGDPAMDLAYAQAEALAIAKGRAQSKVLLRKDANETALRQYGESFRYIHFATHGQFNSEVPLKSALFLAKDANSDGQLTVDKLYSMRLDADLVTLSACETGIGKVANGDDVVGLSRGFLYAGSRSIVSSLWKVDDRATSYLMTSFYDQMKRGDKREALREAQRATMKQYPHPFFWAAFQITGSAM